MEEYIRQKTLKEAGYGLGLMTDYIDNLKHLMYELDHLLMYAEKR